MGLSKMYIYILGLKRGGISEKKQLVSIVRSDQTPVGEFLQGFKTTGKVIGNLNKPWHIMA